MNPRHATTSPLTVLIAPAAVFTVIAFAWALHNPVAFVVVVAGTIFVAAIAVGVVGAGKWIDSRRDLADKDDHIAELEKVLVDERTVRRHTEAAFAEFQQSVSDAGGRVVLPLRPVDKPELYIVDPSASEAPVADDDDWWLRLYNERGDRR